jgi:hypothetical protein
MEWSGKEHNEIDGNGTNMSSYCLATLQCNGAKFDELNFYNSIFTLLNILKSFYKNIKNHHYVYITIK